MANPYGGYQGYAGPPQQGMQGGYAQPPPGQQNFGYRPQQPQQPPPAQNWGGGAPGVDPALMQWFQAVDTDRSGRINALELQQAMTNSNWSHFNAETCRLMVGMFDKNQSGQIDLPEFQSLWTYIQQWKAIFDQYDRDRSGHIDGQELHTALTQMGYRLSPQFCQMVVMRYDLQARRHITLDNFIQACVLLKSVTDTFRQKDVQGTGQIHLNYEEFLTMVMLNKP